MEGGEGSGFARIWVGKGGMGGKVVRDGAFDING